MSAAQLKRQTHIENLLGLDDATILPPTGRFSQQSLCDFFTRIPLNPDSKEGVHLACNIATLRLMFVRTFCLLNFDSRLKLFDPGWRTMIASLNWNVALPLTPPPKRHPRAEEGQTFISFCFYVRIHGWISKFKSTMAAMIVTAARTARSAVATKIEAAQTLAHRSPSAVAAENQPLRRRRTQALSRLLYGLSAGQWPLPSFPSL